ncbi:MAG: hypothetical protein J3K34DRAFT_433401 [Monoraphidium minutum]|nr:MAG: hypothetical protein J3K34DRAFT_433401 [Monoraphidium minutum]
MLLAGGGPRTRAARGCARPAGRAARGRCRLRGRSARPPARPARRRSRGCRRAGPAAWAKCWRRAARPQRREGSHRLVALGAAGGGAEPGKDCQQGGAAGPAKGGRRGARPDRNAGLGEGGAGRLASSAACGRPGPSAKRCRAGGRVAGRRAAGVRGDGAPPRPEAAGSCGFLRLGVHFMGGRGVGGVRVRVGGMGGARRARRRAAGTKRV